eukprot:14100319-Heterocapsa_arctica.AAC.1
MLHVTFQFSGSISSGVKRLTVRCAASSALSAAGYAAVLCPFSGWGHLAAASLACASAAATALLRSDPTSGLL